VKTNALWYLPLQEREPVGKETVVKVDQQMQTDVSSSYSL